jgi:hypothetical protein
MYSFARVTGVGVGGGATGFQALGAFFASGFPNQPVRLPDSGSVDGNQPFFAKTPTATRDKSARPAKKRQSLVCIEARLEFKIMAYLRFIGTPDNLFLNAELFFVKALQNASHSINRKSY